MTSSAAVFSGNGTLRRAQAALDDVNATDVLRALIFTGAFLLAWVTVSPFSDLSSRDLLGVLEGRDGLSYMLFGMLAITGASLAFILHARALAALFTPAFLLLALWLAFAAAISPDTGTSLRRLVLQGMVMAVAASAFLMPAGRVRMAVLLAAVAATVIALSYMGLLVVPHLTIHQMGDLVESRLSGDWRGIFFHKNLAGPIFVFCAFIGIYVARTLSVALGAALFILSAVFLIFSGAKSAMLFFPLVLALSFAATQARGSVLSALLCFGPLVLAAFLTLGTIAIPAMSSAIQALPVETSFTGRTEIWKFALEKVGTEPLTGHGFWAFWGGAEARYGLEVGPTQWIGSVSHAHNGYLDAALSLGIPGLLLTLAVFLVQPFFDLRRVAARAGERALALLLTQIWLFGVYLSLMESFLFNRHNPIWFTFLFAVFGLRFLSRFRSTP